ncbi:MAG: class I SAM-dependent methyltransferase, partial [Actinobacteria bacterium]|nr:class I SAM-dependent methyltransferase [Actinomycetota bacterium]
MTFLDRAFARLYPLIIKSSEEKWLRDARRELLAHAAGDVVEIGTGAGHNLDHYTDKVSSLTLTEASPHMVAKLRGTVRAKRPDARLVEAPAENLPLEDDSADCVVSTLVLCTAEQAPSLQEVRRILRPGGTFLVLEHVAGAGKVAKMQHRARRFTKFFGRGCDVTRNTRASLEAAGFDVSEVR